MPEPTSKKIAYLTAVFPALSHTFILREILALEAQGHAVVPVSVREPGPSGQLGPDEQAMGARTRYLLRSAKNPVALLRAQAAALRHPARYAAALGLAWSTRPAGLRAFVYQMIYFIEATLLAREVQETGCEHIHNHFANSSGTVAMLAARLADVSFSFTLHGPSDLFEAKYWRLDRKIAEASFVACISHFARSQAMLNSDPAHWDRLKIVHCGIEPERYAPAPPAPSPGLRLIFVGRLAPVKGLRVLLTTFPDLLAEVPGITLTIVGDGSERHALEELATAAGRAVRFTGPLSQAQVAEALAQADAMVLPSFAEGVPVVLMEAMASARPVIATRVAGVAELVEDGVSGHLVAPGDAEGLKRAIAELAAHSDARAEMGQAGRQKVLSAFDINKEARWLAEIFRDPGAAGLRPADEGAE